MPSKESKLFFETRKSLARLKLLSRNDFLSALLILSILTSSTAQAESRVTWPIGQCRYVFVENLGHLPKEELDSITRRILIHKRSQGEFDGLLERAQLLVARTKIYERVEELCRSAGQCTQTNIARIIDSEIMHLAQTRDNFSQGLKKLRGASILIASIVSVAVASQFAKSHLPADVRFIAEIVTIASSIAIYRLGAPIWDYFAGVFYRGAFRLTEGKSFSRSNDEMTHLWERHQYLQTKFTVFQQMESNRLQSLLTNLETVLNASAEAITSKPFDEASERAAIRIAALIVKARRLFPEIDMTQDADIRRTWQMLLLDQSKLTSEQKKILHEKIKTKIKVNDPQASQGEAQGYYQRLLDQWFFSVE
jgi:hypothetical protein